MKRGLDAAMSGPKGHKRSRTESTMTAMQYLAESSRQMSTLMQHHNQPEHMKRERMEVEVDTTTLKNGAIHFTHGPKDVNEVFVKRINIPHVWQTIVTGYNDTMAFLAEKGATTAGGVLTIPPGQYTAVQFGQQIIDLVVAGANADAGISGWTSGVASLNGNGQLVMPINVSADAPNVGQKITIICSAGYKNPGYFGFPVKPLPNLAQDIEGSYSSGDFVTCTTIGRVNMTRIHTLRVLSNMGVKHFDPRLDNTTDVLLCLPMTGYQLGEVIEKDFGRHQENHKLSGTRNVSNITLDIRDGYGNDLLPELATSKAQLILEFLK